MPDDAASNNPSIDDAKSRITVVVLTHNRCAELLQTLALLEQLPERPRIVVVDNASQDGTQHCVAQRHPRVRLIAQPVNAGAAARNAGVACVETPYVAFCDDDTAWTPGSLAHAVELLDAWPRLGVVAARVLVGGGYRVDPACERMAASRLPRVGLPGPRLAAFMAGAAVMRAEAFRAAGGYHPRLFLGAEEMLMSLDLASQGWLILYDDRVTTHHRPSPRRDTSGRHLYLARNRVWVACLRLPWPEAWRVAARALREAQAQGLLAPVLFAALRGLPWALGARRVVPAPVSQLWREAFAERVD
ncbi:MAG TPA: glycosyltransferase [Burkholderiaceae bacterium]